MRGFPGKYLVAFSLAGLASCDGPERSATTRAPGGEPDKLLASIFSDLTRSGFCSERAAPTVCYSRAAGLDSIDVYNSESRIETVEAQINLGFHHDPQFLDAADQNVVRLIRYFIPAWAGNATWTPEAMEHARRAVCPRVVKVGPWYVMIVDLRSAGTPGAFQQLTIARSGKTIIDRMTLSAREECNFKTGEFEEDGDNPPVFPYTW